MEYNSKDLAQMIDHTILKPTTTVKDIERLCQEAMEYNFYAVCINPCYVKLAASLLKGSTVKVCTVAGFPLGSTTTEQKTKEAVDAVAHGADEIDMVIALGPVKDGNWAYVKRDIEAVKLGIGDKVVLKVILESSLLELEELKQSCLMAVEAGADFVKTSTGFAEGGATIEAVTVMRSMVGPDKGVKASGGVRTLDQALGMIKAGANRLGSSSGVKIMRELQTS